MLHPLGLDTDTVKWTIKTLLSHLVTLEDSIPPPILYGRRMSVSSPNIRSCGAEGEGGRGGGRGREEGGGGGVLRLNMGSRGRLIDHVSTFEPRFAELCLRVS
eukprot:658647-Prorocentrum_minimum.AAC.1